MKCNECCGDGYNLRIIKKGNGYTTERVTCEHCNGTGEVQTTETKLKPCPFCGNEPTIIVRKGKDGWRDRYSVLCDYEHGGCGAESGWYHYESEAIEAWNRRTK